MSNRGHFWGNFLGGDFFGGGDRTGVDSFAASAAGGTFHSGNSTALKSGQSMSVDGLGRMGIERVQFDSRIDGVYWWQGRGISRDYYYVWCTGAKSEPIGKAWMYRDRDSGHVWLHGWYD